MLGFPDAAGADFELMVVPTLMLTPYCDPENNGIRRPALSSRRMSSDKSVADYFWICDQTLERISFVRLSGKAT
jgi:hypothetical protein